MAEFVAFPKIARLRRDMTITEKIDGTNAAIGIRHLSEVSHWQLPTPVLFEPDATDSIIVGDLVVHAQSRSRVITPEFDNFGFAAWVRSNAEEIAATLGIGLHFGEWWGKGIQRGYGQDRKRFSLFNTKRWEAVVSNIIDVVPILYSGPFNEDEVDNALDQLHDYGSVAAPGFMNPEGIVVYHGAANQMFKITLENDGVPKSKVLVTA